MSFFDIVAKGILPQNNSFTIYSSHVGEWIYNRK